MKILHLIGRETPLFKDDISKNEITLKKIISNSSFLVLGGAGSIGQAVTKEIFKEIQKNFMLLIFLKIIWLNWYGILEVLLAT